MKKSIIVFLSLLFILLPSIVKADTVDYTIKHYYINADIKTDGDMEVTELLVLRGTFNGYIRDIVYKNSSLGNSGYENNKIYNASAIEITDISAKKVDSVTFDTIFDTDFTNLKPNYAANLGYTEKNIVDGKSYKMYFKSTGGSVAFKITYLVKDAIVLHNDVAELYWTFIGNGYDDDIKDLQIKVNLPGIDTTDNFRIWAHGELSGEIQKYENKYILATAPKIYKNSTVDIRTTFNKELVNEYLVNKKQNANALEGIIEVETKRAEQANRERQRIKILYFGFFGIGIIYFISLIIAWIHVYRKYDKEYKGTFRNEYNREFIDDYNVEVVDYLMTKNVSPNALSASIMNLIYKKVITVEEIPTNKSKKEYKFTLNSGKEEKINEAEQTLIEFLFQQIGNGYTFTSKELKDYAKSSKTCEKFSSSYHKWKTKVIYDGKEQGFYENTGKAKKIGVLFVFIAFAIQFLAAFLNVTVFNTFINIFFAFIFLAYTLIFTKRSEKGRDHYLKWKAFKRFLNDFGTFDTKELPEIVLWERYMVYATLFGLAEKVSKCMNVKIKELESEGILGDYTPTFSDYYMFNSINHTFNHAIQSNTNAVNAARASSMSSSGGGHGGGFSSGGGFGGGGGGGRGF